MKSKSISLAFFGFIGVISLADLMGVGIGSLQGTLIVPATGGGVLSGLLTYIGDPFGIAEYGMGVVGAIYTAQFLVSVVVICTFYAMVLASQRGTYSMLDCVVVVLVFFIESIPFLCALPVWGLFGMFLRRRMIYKSIS